VALPRARATDRPPPLRRERRAKDHNRLPPIPGHVRQARRFLVLRRTKAHPRLERDSTLDPVAVTAFRLPRGRAIALAIGLRARRRFSR
jgi:hypothetical protein